MASSSKIRLEDLGRAIAEGQLQELPLVAQGRRAGLGGSGDATSS